MIKQELPEDQSKTSIALRLTARLVLAMGLVLSSAAAVLAIPVSEYHQHIRQALTALDAVSRSKETESEAEYGQRDAEAVRNVRSLLPSSETVEWNGATINVDNAWLHHDLSDYANEPSKTRYDLLKRIVERLKAIEERLTNLEKPLGVAANKSEESRKLAEILQRPEYARKVKAENPLASMVERLIKWIASWFPKPKPVSPGSASLISAIARWVVIIMSLAVLAFVLKLGLQRVFRGGLPKRKSKAKARIVLGEQLEPDQSALDLLTEAEALARRGELRAAIRRAYIALLVELGDRKIISLAQYKTNRDYLRAVREIEPLYGNVKQLTDSFERHWYGLAQANENDWLAFRSAYEQALR